MLNDFTLIIAVLISLYEPCHEKTCLKCCCIMQKQRSRSATLIVLLLYITKTRPCNIQQYFTALKNVNFKMKFLNIFLIFAQNIDCGYTLEPPQ